MPRRSGPVGAAGRYQKAQQDAANRETGPPCPVHDPVVALQPTGVLQPHDPQGGDDSPLAGGEQGADDEHERIRSDAAVEQWRGRRQQV